MYSRVPHYATLQASGTILQCRSKAGTHNQLTIRSQSHKFTRHPALFAGVGGTQDHSARLLLHWQVVTAQLLVFGSPKIIHPTTHMVGEEV